MFIIITGLLATTLMLGLSVGTQKTPIAHQQMVATATARKCMEWFIGQRRINGYSTLPCPNTTVPGFCTTPTGYSITTNVACTTLSGDANYKTITVTVSGLGDASLTTLIANY